MTIINCAVTKGDLPIKIRWLLNGHPVETIEGVNIMSTKKRVSQLSIDDVQAHHSGEYSCIASNRAGNVTFSALLRVNGDNFILFFFKIFFLVPPQIVPFDFGSDPVNSGDMATTQCAVTKGDFPIKIRWTLNNHPVNDIPGVSVSKINNRISTLSIESVEDIHAGTYTCFAANKAGRVSHTSLLNVNGTFSCF